MKKLALILALALGAASSGCGSDDSGGGSGPAPDTDQIPQGGRDADGRIVPECQAFPLQGMKYSPGGNVLPNKCAPWHQTLNNPYAIRCVDVYPDFKTPYPGDDFCILPPPPELGIQVGMHPQGKQYWEQIWAGDLSGYQNLAGTQWELEPGGEKTQNYRGSADNTEDHNYYRTYFRMRTGSHHQIISMHEYAAPDEEWTDKTSVGFFDPSEGPGKGILGGEQRPDDGNPSTFEKPAEDAGQYLVWPAHPSIVFNMHHFNTRKVPILREAWINVWWETDATKLVYWYMGLNRDNVMMNVPPNTKADFHYSWNIPEGSGDYRLLRVFGHRHFWTTNFSTWIERKGNPEPELIYQSFNWLDMPTYRYDSVAQNPVPNADEHSDGAATGEVLLHAGDKLHFNCHVEYTDERAAVDANAPKPEDNINTRTGKANLNFGNEAYNREMCIQFGNVTNGFLAFPAVNTDPLPDFATR